MTLRLLWGILPPCYGGVVWAVHNASTATSEPAMMASLGRMPSSRGLLYCHYVHDLISVIVITRTRGVSVQEFLAFVLWGSWPGGVIQI